MRPERSTRSRKVSFPCPRRAMTRPARRRFSGDSDPGSRAEASSRTAAISSRSGKRFGAAIADESTDGGRARPRDPAGCSTLREALPGVLRNQRLLPSGLDLLHGPGVAVGVAEAEERPAVSLVEDGELAHVDAACDQILARCVRVGHDELQAT